MPETSSSVSLVADSNKPSDLVFSIVLCTRDRARLLKKALESLLRLDYSRECFELLVVDNASSDDTREVVREAQARTPFEIRYLFEQRVGLSAARNHGIRAARGRYIFFTDDDQLVDPQALREHQRAAEKYDARVLQGRIDLVFEGERPSWFRSELSGLLGETPAVSEGPLTFELRGGNLVVRRDLFDEVEPFREDLGKGAAGYSEDTEFALRLKQRGEAIIYAPAARIQHMVEPARATRSYLRRSAFEKGASHVLAERPFLLRGVLAKLTLRQAWRYGAEATRHRLRDELGEGLVAETRAAFSLGKLAGYARLSFRRTPKTPPGGTILRAMQIDEQIEKLLRSPPSLHVDGSGKRVNYGVDARLIAQLREHVRPGHRTLETGSGISTVVFLALGARHRSVSPDGGEAERIREYCKDAGIDASQFTPVVGRSEEILPTLSNEPVLDLALVDGNHAFPAPCIDWYYATRILKRGGVMIVDDIELWTGQILADFLDEEEVWQRLERTDRFASYRMLDDADKVLARWWGQQPLVKRLYEKASAPTAAKRRFAFLVNAFSRGPQT
jgi:glucosyl-dolichyl phosphate glucuronosyltransferase